jgi:glycosyltransferase involved in cell wall biosynthesis
MCRGKHPRKGIGDLLHAFAQLRRSNPDAHLYLAGEGPMLDAYKALATELGVGDSAIFLGFCDDPRPYLFATDIFVLASHADPCPLVIAEARHAGVPIIASEVDGIPAMLDYGDAGILVPPSQPDVLAAALKRLLDEPALRRDYAARAKRGAERFTVERVCRDMEKIYADLL